MLGLEDSLTSVSERIRCSDDAIAECAALGASYSLIWHVTVCWTEVLSSLLALLCQECVMQPTNTTMKEQVYVPNGHLMCFCTSGASAYLRQCDNVSRTTGQWSGLIKRCAAPPWDGIHVR